MTGRLEQSEVLVVDSLHQQEIRQTSSLPVYRVPTTTMKAAGEVPTLIAAAKGQGEVRVWAAERRQVWKEVVSWCAVCAYGCFDGAVLHQGPGMILLILYTLWLAMSSATSQKPGACVTDSAGMAGTTRSGAYALQWNEIESVRRMEGLLVYCGTLNDGERIIIHLEGYPLPIRQELIALMVHRARLHPHTADSSLLIHRP